MFMTRSEYDIGVNTFSPEGRIFQVEYAIEAIKVCFCIKTICNTVGKAIEWGSNGLLDQVSSLAESLCCVLEQDT